MRFRGSWRIGRIAGITICVHPSWLVVYALFAWSATVAAPLLSPQLSRTSSIVLGLCFALVLFASVIAHEFAHALVARRLGIPIAGITLFLFGGVAMITRDPDSAWGELKMAIAGPALSVVLAAFFFGLYFVAAQLGWLWAWTLCLFLALSNGLLAVFNMLPAFPSDGGRVLRSLLWMWRKSQAQATGWASNVSLVVAAGLVITGIALAVDSSYRMRGLWWVLMGAFLAQAAMTSRRQARNDLALEQLKVRECMYAALVPVSARTSVAAFLGEVAGQPRTGYPVMEQGSLVGLADVTDTAGIPLPQWSQTTVGAIMTPVSKTTPLSGEESARDALSKLHEANVSELPVFENGVLVGVVTQDAIYRAVRAARAR